MSTATLPKTQKFNHDETQRRVRHPLRLVRRIIGGYIILEGLALTLLAGVLVFWFGLAVDLGLYYFDFGIFHGVDWILEFNEIDPSGISSFGCRVIVLTAIVVGLMAFGFSKVVLRWFREFNDRAVALVLERRFKKELGDRLITAVELANPKLTKKYGFSQDMVEKTIMEAVAVLKTLPVHRVFNWRRLFGLWFMLAFLTFGTWIATMIVFTGSTAVFAERWMSPWGFAWRFYDVAAIWTERNILMMDTYWPRRAYLEIGGFQPSKENPDDMRVARDDKRPELRVRAFEWVIADRDKAKAPYGWRPLLWADLPRVLKHKTISDVKIPQDFPYWRLELDELEPDLVGAIFDSEMITISSRDMREHMKQPEVKKKIVARGAEAKLEAWLDWTTWSVDKLNLQKEHLVLRQQVVVESTTVASTVGLMTTAEGFLLARQSLFKGRNDFQIDYAPVEALFTELKDAGESAWLSRTIRRVEIPKLVEINFVGELGGSNASYPRQDGNKYNISLEALKESTNFKFRARGENYYTKRKSITLVAAPTPALISTDTEEPAYIYHRVKGPDQMSLRGLKHVNKDLARSITGESNEIRVALGSELAINVIIDNTPLTWGSVALNRIRFAAQREFNLKDGQGLQVASVEAESDAAKAGLQAGDILLKVDDVPVPNDFDQFTALVAQRADEKSSFTVRRAEEQTDKANPKNKTIVLKDLPPTDAVKMANGVHYAPRRLRADRPVFVVPPTILDPNYEAYPGQPAVVHKDQLGFTLHMDNITRNHEFVVEFYDEDNIRGKRRFRVDRVIDSEPLLGNLSVAGYRPRQPKFRTLAPQATKQDKDKDKDKDKKDVDEPRDYREFEKAYLITPDARIPFDCKVVDDYGLVRVGYYYKYRKIDFELVSYGTSKKLPVMKVGDDAIIYRARHAIANLQFWPGNPISYHAAPHFLAWSAVQVQRDINVAEGYKEGLVGSAAFEEVLKREAENMVRPEDVKARLAGQRSTRQWEVDLKDYQDAFDVQLHLKGLKASPLDAFGQMHYFLQVAVQATDNNVETGVEFFDEIDDGPKGKRPVLLRGNTRKNANGYINFIVISENELLAQIAIEEGTLREKLEAAKEKIDSGKVSIMEQMSKTQKPDAEMEGILNRMNEIRTGVGAAGNILADTHAAYENILKEMSVNRIKAEKTKAIQSTIITRLDEIVAEPDPKKPELGSLKRTTDSVQKAHELVESEYNAKKAPDVAAHERNMKDARDQLEFLSKDIQRVLDAMSEGIAESELIALIAEIEGIQRKRTRELYNLWVEEQDVLMKKLLEGDKKDPPPEEKKKKLGRLQTAPDAQQLADITQRARREATDAVLVQVSANHDAETAVRLRQRLTATK